MKKIAALLTVHNRKEKTIQCLYNLFRQENINNEYSVEVFLTDDGCTDGTSEAVQRLFPQIHILEGDGNLFWNRGMHVAWKEASKSFFDYFLWLNDDTFLYADAISRLLNNSILKNNASIICGSTCDTENHLKITYGGLDKNRQVVYSDTQFMPCFYMHGNIVLIPKEVFDRVGLNDPFYRHSLGDHDYGLMARRRGIEVLVSPGVYGECDVHDVISRWKNPAFPLQERWDAFFKPTGQNPFEFFYFRKKHFGFISAVRTFITNFVHVLFPSYWKDDDCR